MIFGFWTDASSCPTVETLPMEACAAWRAAWPTYVVWRDADIRAHLPKWSEDAIFLYDTIRIPSCRSDLARLVLLHAFGGLYVDLHAAPGRPARLSAVLDRLRTAELVIFDESANNVEDRHTWLMNGALAAQAGSTTVARLIEVALTNLRVHHAREEAEPDAHIPYSIFDLTGPALLWHEMFDRVPEGGALKSAYRGRVAIWPVDGRAADEPLYFHKHEGFRPLALHWSERQKSERLFESGNGRCGLMSSAL